MAADLLRTPLVGDYPPFDGQTITLHPYGYRWIVMDTDGSG